MTDKQKVEEVVVETAALETLAPNSMPADAPKTAKIASAVDAMSKMSGETINKFMEMMAQFDSVFKADVIPDGSAAKNQSTIVAKGAMKEDIASLFTGEELSEDFKEKATTILEAAAQIRVTEKFVELEEAFEEKTKMLEEEYATKLTEEIASINTYVVDNLDKYLEYVVENWMKENEVAIVSSLKSEMTEQFISGLKNLFVEHYVAVPEEKLDVVESMNSTINDLQKKLSEQIDKNIELNNILEQTEAEKVFADVCEGLAATQVEKLQTLAEGIEYADASELKSKLEVIKESFFATETTVSTPKTMLFEEIDEEYEEAVTPKVTGIMAKYVNTISNTAKNR